VDLTKKARKGICCYLMSPKEPFASEMWSCNSRLASIFHLLGAKMKPVKWESSN